MGPTASQGATQDPRRKALVYVRQSTLDQFQNNKGSRSHQLSQVDIARALGFTEERFEVLEDAGLTGSASAHRPKYQYMLSEIRAGRVAYVIASDPSRVSRDSKEWLAFIYLCGAHDVQLVLDGKAMNPKKGDERFFAGIMAMAAEYDNYRRRESSVNGRLGKFKDGKAVIPPPVGYVWGPDDGTWIKDDRPGVQDSISAHYWAIREARSLRKAARLLREKGIDTPRKLPGGNIGWTKPTVHSLRRFVRNEAYVGDSVFARRRADTLRERDPRGRYRLIALPPEEIMVMRDHHEPYITRAERAELLELLKRNAFCKRHGVIGPGSALAQGCLRCAKHRMWLMRAIQKQGSKRDRSIYVCTGTTLEGGRRCGLIPAWVIDTPLRAAVVARLRPHALDELQATMKQAEYDLHAEERRQRDALHRLKLQVDDLQFRYNHVNIRNWAVRESMEDDLQAKRVELKRRETEHADECRPRVFLDDGAYDELRDVCEDVDALIDAATTEPRDRKELVRIMVDQVVLEERTPERVRFRIIWQDRWPDSVHEVLLFPYAHRVIREMTAGGAKPETIALRLNSEGVLTKYRTAWSATTVARQFARDRAKIATVCQSSQDRGRPAAPSASDLHSSAAGGSPSCASGTAPRRRYSSGLDGSFGYE